MSSLNQKTKTEKTSNEDGQSRTGSRNVTPIMPKNTLLEVNNASFSKSDHYSNENEKNGINLFIRLLAHFNINFDLQEETTKGVSNYIDELFCCMLDQKIYQRDNVIYPDNQEMTKYHRAVERIIITDSLLVDIDIFRFDEVEKPIIKNFIVKRKEMLAASLYSLSKCNYILEKLKKSENKRRKISKKLKSEQKRMNLLRSTLSNMKRDYEESKVVNIAKRVLKGAFVFTKNLVRYLRRSKSNEQNTQNSSEEMTNN